MRIVLYSRPRPSYRAEDLSRLIGVLRENGIDFRINGDFAAQITDRTGFGFDSGQIYRGGEDIGGETDLMVCYGGDGTFLGGVRLLDNRPIPIVGVNSGHLGFLANIDKERLGEAFAELKAGRYTLRERSLLHAEGDFTEMVDYPYAFNELTVQRQNANMISTEVYVNDEMIATCYGDGVLVSTPTGSTAYSLSVGGPVVAPDCNCFVVSPIAPHNLTMRPVVIPDHSVVTLRVSTREGDCSVSLDNRNYSARNGAVFTIKKAEKSIFLVHFQNISFYDTLRKKMMWGIDGRDMRR